VRANGADEVDALNKIEALIANKFQL
jgi:phosphotransferase system HPr-like phosphotransfer protein